MHPCVCHTIILIRSNKRKKPEEGEDQKEPISQTASQAAPEQPGRQEIRKQRPRKPRPDQGFRGNLTTEAKRKKREIPEPHKVLYREHDEG